MVLLCNRLLPLFTGLRLGKNIPDFYELVTAPIMKVWVCVCVCVCAWVCMCLCVFECVYVCIFLCVHLGVCMSICTYVPVCMRLHLGVCRFVHVHATLHVCGRVCVCVCRGHKREKADTDSSDPTKWD